MGLYGEGACIFVSRTGEKDEVGGSIRGSACIFVGRTGGKDEVGESIRRRCMHICEADWREG